MKGPTVVLRIPLADQWDAHDSVAARLYRLGAITPQCAITPCEPCQGTAPAGRCACPCHGRIPAEIYETQGPPDPEGRIRQIVSEERESGP